MAKILIVEDDVGLALTVKDSLEFQNYRVEMLHDGSEALHYLQSFTYDLVLLDVDLPGISGVELCKAVRAHGDRTPIIMLTGLDQLPDKMTGFDAGTDDYLTKPFHLDELSARIRVLLNRSSNVVVGVLQAGELTLDPTSRRIAKQGAELHLSPLEFDLLEYLLRHPNKVHSPDNLLNAVWPSDSERTADTVRTCIKKLRDKIDSKESPSIIKNVHGSGYRLDI